MNQLTNTADLGLAMAVWLAHDDYTAGDEQFPDKDVISATSLLKGTRQLILSKRVPASQNVMDVSDFIASRLGHAIHDSVEQAWEQGYGPAMKKLGYPQKMIDKIRINPETVEDGDIPVYLEQRYFREIDMGGYSVVISGKFDQIIDGEVNDTKTTSAYTYVNNTKEEDYRIQGSIYRWINPDKVTSDIMRIQHVFTDWQRALAKSNPKYPDSRVKEFKVKLMSLQETENWIRTKIREIAANQNLPEEEIVRCTPKELWMSDPQFKFYSDPKKAEAGGRSTRNFDNYPAAAAYRNKVNKGVIVEVQSAPKACGYCAGFEICSQKDEYDHEGS